MNETSAMRRAVFLDRDGVINRAVLRHGKPYPPQGVEDFSIYPDAPRACQMLQEAGFVLVVVTNQPDVGRGLQSMDVVEAMHARMTAALPIDRIEACYEPDQETSRFHKPAPGMLLRAASQLSLNLAESYMVGDRWRDIDCGYAAGCTTVLIDRGYPEGLRREPHFRAGSLREAAEIILTDSRNFPRSTVDQRCG
jgi:D-glycero-D-manno-heptose 1,7-bisphosphate phosphatase